LDLAWSAYDAAEEIMSRFEIQDPTRTCAQTGQHLEVGERFYGVLLEENGRFVRKDYSANAWNGPPANAIAYWSGRIPATDRPKKPTFNDELLWDCFDHLATATEPNRLSFRYVVALLLMRRKRLKFEDARRGSDDQDVLVVRDSRTGARIEIVDPRLREDEIEAVQQEVFHVLGWD
jgi:hypothetical protein